MEQILPALEGRLRQFRREAARLAAQQPRLAGQLAPSNMPPDVHVDRLLQGVAVLQARTALALERARCQQDEHQLERLFPEQLRPFPACSIGPAPGLAGSLAITGARFCSGPEAAIELDLDLGSAKSNANAAATSIDLYIDGDAAFSAALRSALLDPGQCDRDAASATPAAPADGGSRTLRAWPFSPAGLDLAEALLPRRPGAHAGLALLREFFTFPARFNLVRLDLSGLRGARRWTLRLPARASGSAAVLLQGLHAAHLRAGWQARADLRRTAAAPIALDGRHSEYPLSVQPELEIFSIDRVRVCDAGRVWELPAIAPGAERQGWAARRVASAPAGHEWRIAFRGAIAWQSGATASIDLTCYRRDAVLGRAARGAGCRWQLNSLLALEQLPQDAGALREVMASQAIDGSPSALAIIGAVQKLDVRTALLRSNGAAPLVGSELRLEVDDAAFAGCGLLLFAQVMDRFFGECAHLNTFSRLVLLSARTGKELIRCKARNAGTLLE
jgi:type VI secretion system protein ImpG